MKEKPAIASLNELGNDFKSDWTVLRLDQDNLWFVQYNYNRLFINCLWIWYHSLFETFVKEKVHKIFLEILTDNYLSNRKWSCYLENCDSSGKTSHLIHFRSHLKLSSDKSLTDAQQFLHLNYFGWRRHFALDVIVLPVNWYWQLDLKWTSTTLCISIMHR